MRGRLCLELTKKSPITITSTKTLYIRYVQRKYISMNAHKVFVHDTLQIIVYRLGFLDRKKSEFIHL
jgi:hypothetical protein